MNRKSYDVNSLPETIVIGRRTETGVLAVRFDCTAWFAYWPDLSLSILVTPPGGSMPYLAKTYMDGKVLVWDVSDIDTAAEGFGTLEIMGKAAGRKKLSAIAKTQILRTTSTKTTKPPEVTQTWLEQMVDTAIEANESANRAQSASSAATTSASSAASSAASAASSATRAENAATTAAEQAAANILANGTVGNAEKLGDQAPEYYLSPQDLITNGNFCNPVNQRGLDSYTTAWGMTIDRWYLGHSAAYDPANPSTVTMTLLAGRGIRLTNNAPDKGYIRLQQRIEEKYLKSGMHYTHVICWSDGTRTAKKISAEWISSNISPNGYLALSTNVHEPQAEIKWVALYEGVYTAETLPQYVPKPYAVELAECQYYANVIETDAWGRVGFCKTTQGETATIWAPTTPPMRPGGIPSVSILEGTIESFSVEFNQLIATSISGFGCQSGNHHNILVNLSGNATASVVEPLRNRTENKVKVLISREL